MEWGSRPQGKNGWVATSCLGKKKKQTNTALPVYVYTIGQSQKSLHLGQLYGYTARQLCQW